MDKRSEQFGVKITPELKREVTDFCNRNGLSESDLDNIALMYFFTAYNTHGPVKMLGESMGATR